MFETRSASATSATVTKRARPSNGCATVDHPSLRRDEGKPAMLVVLLGIAFGLLERVATRDAGAQPGPPSWRDRSVAACTASRNAARTERCSRASRPAAVVPPGE